MLDGLEKDGSGEPLCGQSQNVKTRILNMERLSPSPSLSTTASSANLYSKPPINNRVGWPPDMDPTQALSRSQFNYDPFSISFYGIPPIPSQPASAASGFGHIPTAPKYESAPDLTHLDSTPKGISESRRHFRLFAAPICHPGDQAWLADRFAEAIGHNGSVKDRFTGDNHGNIRS